MSTGNVLSPSSTPLTVGMPSGQPVSAPQPIEGLGGMFNLSNLVQQLRLIAQAIGQFNQSVSQVFPLASSSVAATATAGAATLPAAPTAFLVVTVAGTSYKVPLYLP